MGANQQMPVQRHIKGYNATYTITGPFDEKTANEYQDLNALDYNQIGDALGAIIDIRQAYITVRGLRTIQRRLSNVVFDVPVAIIGQEDSVFAVFLRGVEILTSRGKRRFDFFDNEEDATAWIDGWFKTYHKDRPTLYGQVSAQIAPTSSGEDGQDAA
jgi:hypothetical protein